MPPYAHPGPVSALAPAALLLVVGVLLALVLRRWWDAVPPRAWAFFALVLGLLFGPVLWGGDVLLPFDALRERAPFLAVPAAEPHANPLQGDLLQLVAPSLTAVRAAYARGQWPLWNDRAGAGMPLLADPQAQALQPLALLGLLLPVPAAAGVTAGVRVLVALVFTFLLLRRQGCGELAALFGALAWGLGGFVQLWLGWPLANVAVLLPLLLYAVAMLDERAARRDDLLVVVALAALLLAGHPEGILYALVLVAAFAGARLLARSAGRRLELLWRGSRAALLAALLAAPGLLPAADLLRGSARAAALRHLGAASSPDIAASALPGHDAAAAATFAPATLRLLPVVAPNAFGNGRYADPSGVVYWGWSNTNEDASGFVGSAAVLLALLALLPLRGARRRRAQELVFAGALLAGLAVLAWPPSWLAGVPLLAQGQRVLLLVGFATAMLAACEFDRQVCEPGGQRALVAMAILLCCVLLWGTLAHGHPQHAAALAVLRIGSLKLQLKVLALGVAALLLARRWPLAGAGLAVVLVWELLALHRPANPPSPGRLALPETPAIAFLRSRLGMSRMAAFGRAFPANQPALYGFADARLYNPAQPAAEDALLAPLLATPRGNVPELELAEDPLLDRLGVRYLVTERGAAVPPSLRRVFEDDSSTIFERAQALPPFFLEGAPSAAVRAVRQAPESWRLGLALAAPSTLSSGVFQDGNWRAVAIGSTGGARRQALAAARGPFVGALLPADTGLVDVLYRPRSFLYGGLAAGLAIAWLLALTAAPAEAGFGDKLPRPGPLPRRDPS